MRRISLLVSASLWLALPVACKKPASTPASIKLSGSLRSPCLATNGLHRTRTIVMASGAPVSITESTFKDAACTLLVQTTTQLPKAVEIVLAPGQGEPPSAVDFKLKEATTTISDAAHLEALKAANVCGLANALLATPVTITTCLPEIFYDLWLIKADQSLTTGLLDPDHDGLSAQRRPISFDFAGTLRPI